jgi:transcriptional regulator with XRE-family HTH domain
LTPEAFKRSRQSLRLSQSELAQVLQLRHGANAIRDMENGKREISGPVIVAMRMMLEHGVPGDTI